MEKTVPISLKILPHFDPQWPLPAYQSLGAAGADIRAQLGKGEKILLKPGEKALIPTGLAVEIPDGYELQVRPRSGLSWKTGLMILNSPGTIDCDYRGEIKIIIGNLGVHEETITHGDRVAQLVLAPVTRAIFRLEDELNSTQRGPGGFGSTGIG